MFLASTGSSFRIYFCNSSHYCFLPGVLRALGDGAPTDRALRETGDGSIIECGDVIIDSGEPAGC